MSLSVSRQTTTEITTQRYCSTTTTDSKHKNLQIKTKTPTESRDTRGLSRSQYREGRDIIVIE
eukprot:1367603-Amorphochlora_amoeboformis.AAC.1